MGGLGCSVQCIQGKIEKNMHIVYVEYEDILLEEVSWGRAPQNISATLPCAQAHQDAEIKAEDVRCLAHAEAAKAPPQTENWEPVSISHSGSLVLVRRTGLRSCLWGRWDGSFV